MNERQLFDPSVLATRCPICGCDKNPHDPRTQDCGVDQSRKAGDWIRRPQECLNHPRPQTDPIGF